MKTPTTILVATDFSEPSAAALEYAIGLARPLGAKVHLFHAFELPVLGPPSLTPAFTVEASARIVDAVRVALAREAETCAKEGFAITTSAEEGDAREHILAAAATAGAELIVMGTHGRKGIARALIGSVTEAVVRTSPVPVLTVHAPIAKERTP